MSHVTMESYRLHHADDVSLREFRRMDSVSEALSSQKERGDIPELQLRKQKREDQLSEVAELRSNAQIFTQILKIPLIEIPSNQYPGCQLSNSHHIKTV